MNTRKEGQSPKLKVEITKENYDKAVKASSGGCLVADAIKREYPKFSHVQVDVATTRISDRKTGERYVYLTPAPVQEMLLAFDQGWPESSFPRTIRFRKAVKIFPVTVSASNVKATAERQTARLAELEAKEKSGESLTDGEARALGGRNRKQPIERPGSYGPAKSKVVRDHIVVVGGAPPKTS